ncbi:hypothetical protein [Spirulina subsalsa]|uniref:hypothetical protein n=1 Tax=Spirulina subsalsa TaxID=54311 RepID=UPI0002F9D4A0|nr:hypothetical protein [Spirulina subsalsa]
MAIQEETYRSKLGANPDLTEHQLDLGQYVAVSDVVAVLSELARHPSQLEALPSKEARGNRSRSPQLLSLEERQRGIRPNAPHIPTAMREAPPLGEKTVDELSQELWELKLVSLSDADYYGRQLTKLKNRLWWLTGLLVGAIASLSGGLAWTAVHLRQAEHQITFYESELTTQRLRIEQIEGARLGEIEQVMRSLQTQIPENLGEDLTNNTQDIAALKTQLQQLESKLAAQDKALSVLIGTLQGMINSPGNR